LVAQGFSQIEGIDFGETYALMDRLESIRILLAYSSLHMHHIIILSINGIRERGKGRENMAAMVTTHPLNPSTGDLLPLR
jgi:hypothetical protein